MAVTKVGCKTRYSVGAAAAHRTSARSELCRCVRVDNAGVLVAPVRRKTAVLSISGVGRQSRYKKVISKGSAHPPRHGVAATRTLAQSELCKCVRAAYAGVLVALVRRQGAAATRQRLLERLCIRP